MPRLSTIFTISKQQSRHYYPRLQYRGIASQHRCINNPRHTFRNVEPSTSLSSSLSSTTGHPSYHLFESRRSSQMFSLSAGMISVHQPGLHPEDPKKPPSKLKDPKIPDGHPVDTDGRPLGHVIPDYDVELPIFSFGGYAKDFDAWSDPPVFPPTSWPKIAKYNYEELEVKDFPVVYEMNLAYAMNFVCLLMLVIPISMTKWQLHQYYKANSEFYTNGWPHFHYEPTLDIVPLTARDDGLPPESLILQFNDGSMVRHEMKEDDEDGDDE